MVSTPSNLREPPLSVAWEERGGVPTAIAIRASRLRPDTFPYGEVFNDRLYAPSTAKARNYSRLDRLELRKQDHVPDRRAVGEEHHEAVDADPFAGGRRKAILERADVVGVVVHRLLVAGFLRLGLRGEARRLVLG